MERRKQSPKEVASYRHRVDSPKQEPDRRPGHYYVTVHDGPKRYGFLSGPYVNDHAAALADVDAVRSVAERLDSRASFYAFGTARVEPTYSTPGVLNRSGDFEIAPKRAGGTG